MVQRVRCGILAALCGSTPTLSAGSPPAPLGNSFQFGPYRCTQINVGPLGQNIPGDSANSPILAVDPTDPRRMVVSIRYFPTLDSFEIRSAYAFSVNGGVSWEFAGVVDDERRNPPFVAAGPVGDFYVIAAADGICTDVFRSPDGGETLLPPVFAYGGAMYLLTVDTNSGASNGNIYVTWESLFPCSGGGVTRSFDGGSTFEFPTALPELAFASTTIDCDGSFYAIGTTQTSGLALHRLLRSTNVREQGEIPTFDVFNVDLGGRGVLGGGFQTAYGPHQIAIDCSGGPHNGFIYAAATIRASPSSADQGNIMFSRSIDGGASWSPPARLNEPGPSPSNARQWFPVLDVAPNGRLDIAWYDARNSADQNGPVAELFYRSSGDGGQSWSAEAVLTPPFSGILGGLAVPGGPTNLAGGLYNRLVSDNLGANIVFTAAFNGEQDVWFLRVGPQDCNGNGVPDADEISSGVLTDCNADGIPDICDADCNGNGLSDICDIASGAETDCNGNQIPDLCDLLSGEIADCNNNGIPDECDTASGLETDCNENAIPDACEIASGSVADCNENGVPDECDAAGPLDADCNANGILDTCELRDGLAADCNANQIPDDCDIASATSMDCNANALPDECELTSGAATDCNVNGVLDECDVATRLEIATAESLNFGTGNPAIFNLGMQPPSVTDVEIAAEARADLSLSSENADVRLNGVSIGTIFATGGSDCPPTPTTDLLTLPAATWNAAAEAGPIELSFVATTAVNPTQCGEDGFLRATVRYAFAAVPDDDHDGVPDACQFARGDTNCDGLLTVNDIPGFVLALVAPPDYAVQFPDCTPLSADVNGDGRVTLSDIAPFVAILVGP